MILGINWVIKNITESSKAAMGLAITIMCIPLFPVSLGLKTPRLEVRIAPEWRKEQQWRQIYSENQAKVGSQLIGHDQILQVECQRWLQCDPHSCTAPEQFPCHKRTSKTMFEGLPRKMWVIMTWIYLIGVGNDWADRNQAKFIDTFPAKKEAKLFAISLILQTSPLNKNWLIMS